MNPKIQTILSRRVALERLYYQTPAIIIGGYAGGQIFCESIGEAKVDCTPISPSSAMPFGSISKLYTAVLCMVMESKGVLNFSDPVSNYLNVDWQGKEKHVTIERLLSHHSGLNLTRDHLDWRDEAYLKYDENLFASEPGSEFIESEVGYQVLSALLENATGQDLASLYQTHLFEPAGLKESYGECKKPAIDGHSAKVAPAILGEGLKTLPTFNYVGADGGLSASIEDLIQFGVYILEGINGKGPFGSAGLIRLSEKKGKRGEKSYYSYGCYIKEMSFGSLYGHGGDLSGYQAGLYFNLEEEVVVAELSNGPGFPYRILEALLESIVIDDPRPLIDSAPSAMDSAVELPTSFAGGSITLQSQAGECALEIEGKKYKLVDQGGDIFLCEYPLLRPFMMEYDRESKQFSVGPYTLSESALSSEDETVAVYLNSSQFPPEYVLLYKRGESTYFIDPGSVCYGPYQYQYGSSSDAYPEVVESTGTLFKKETEVHARELLSRLKK